MRSSVQVPEWAPIGIEKFSNTLLWERDLNFSSRVYALSICGSLVAAIHVVSLSCKLSSLPFHIELVKGTQSSFVGDSVTFSSSLILWLLLSFAYYLFTVTSRKPLVYPNISGGLAALWFLLYHSFKEISGSFKTMNGFQRIIQVPSNLTENVEMSRLKLDGLEVMMACTTNIQLVILEGTNSTKPIIQPWACRDVRLLPLISDSEPTKLQHQQPKGHPHGSSSTSSVTPKYLLLCPNLPLSHTEANTASSQPKTAKQTPPLAGQGERQCDDLARSFETHIKHIKHIFSSPMRRCLETARKGLATAVRRGVKIQVMPALAGREGARPWDLQETDGSWVMERPGPRDRDTIDRKVFRNSIDIALRMPPSERTRVRDQKPRALRNQEEKLMQLPRETESSTRTRRLAKMTPEARQARENLLKHLREERESDIMNKADMPNTAVPSPMNAKAAKKISVQSKADFWESMTRNLEIQKRVDEKPGNIASKKRLREAETIALAADPESRNAKRRKFFKLNHLLLYRHCCSHSFAISHGDE